MTNTDIPAAEVDISTKRLRLYHATWVNRSRLDMQLRPLFKELEEGAGNDSGRMAILFKATFRGAVTLINHYLHFDVREHPSAILLILLKLLDDRTFNSIWMDYAPLVSWVNNDDNSSRNEVSTLPAAQFNGNKDVFSDTSSRPTDVSRGHERVGQDDVLQNTSKKRAKQKTDSDTGQ